MMRDKVISPHDGTRMLRCTPTLSVFGWRSALSRGGDRRARPSTRGTGSVRVLGRTRLRCYARSWSVSWGVLVIGEDFIDGAFPDAGEDGVGVLVVGEGNQSDGQCPAATSRPRCIINQQCCTEDVPAFGGEEIPRDDQVASGIAHAQTPEVNESIQVRNIQRLPALATCPARRCTCLCSNRQGRHSLSRI